ncbi:MAG: magnesium transporter [marine benthic group bacterium]|nr:magnesium transporter [Candidatus Benthicola marisminoris]
MSEKIDHMESWLGQALALLATGDYDGLSSALESVHPSDLADLVEQLEDDQRLALLRHVPSDLAADTLAEMEDVERPGELLLQLEPRRTAAIVHEMADDDAADLIGDLEPEQRAQVLAVVDDEEAAEIEELLTYPEESAGGLMTREVLSVSARLTAAEAIAEIRRQAHEDFDFYTIFVVDPDGTFRGVVSLQDLVIADPTTPISEITEEPPAVVTVDTDQEEVGKALSRYNLASLGVVDALGRLVGRITFDDVIDVVEAEATEDILRFAAVSDEEEIRGTTLDAIRSRLPWLLLSVISAAVASSVVFAYQSTIEAMALLAVAMPVIAGVGGNAGTQALAVTIRRIALSDETVGERMGVIWKELLVGLVNGLVMGVVAAVLGLLFTDAGVMFGVVVLLAMWGSLLIASFAGAFIPIFLERIGVDPAVASSPFVTTLTDLFGFFLLLGLATAVLM